ncbi:MAG: phage Gp37/Gp68 family protein [Thermotogaceae bacterium]|nr:phage Gp37/Gp68 family protein [Thermotogaceae bacterium]
MAFSSMVERRVETWNPITGCSKISLGCVNCYAERLAKRLQSIGNPKYKNGFKLTLHPEKLDQPLRWKKPKVIFIASMGDLFHEKVPDDFILKVFRVMNRAHWHIFQVLTKRAERLADLSEKLPWAPNIWIGVTVEHCRYVYRINLLKFIPAVVRFISFEPLLSDIPPLDLEGIDWAIVGGESGPRARPMRPEWVRHIRDMCKKQNVAFFFKQWGGLDRKKNGRVLDGRTWVEYPTPVLSRL